MALPNRFLRTYDQVERWLHTDHEGHPDLPFWMMTLSYGVHQARALRDWCDETLAALVKSGKVRNKKKAGMSMALPVVIQALRWTHILAGFTAFFIAPVPLLTAKGGKTHRRWGKIYFWAMAVVAATAMVLALWRPILFLAFIAVFSFYFAFRGYRVLSRKLPLQGQGPGAIDWAAAVLAFLGSATLIVLGIVRPSPVWVQLSVVAIVFGVIGVAFAASDLWKFMHPPADQHFWWYAHMGGMIGSYIAAVSAFSVVNFHFLPPAVRWLWPSAIGVPGIFIWVGYYQRKFNRKGSPVRLRDRAEFGSGGEESSARPGRSPRAIVGFVAQ